MQDVSLRTTTAEDVPALTALLERLPEWFTAEAIETVRSAGADPPGLAAVDKDDAIVGFLLWEERPDEWEICWIAVARDLHRRGIGRMLLTHMLARVRKAGAHRVRVKTLAPTVCYVPYDRTRAFYEAVGFALQCIEPHGWPDGSDKAEYVVDLAT